MHEQRTSVLTILAEMPGTVTGRPGYCRKMHRSLSRLALFAEHTEGFGVKERGQRKGKPLLTSESFASAPAGSSSLQLAGWGFLLQFAPGNKAPPCRSYSL